MHRGKGRSIWTHKANILFPWAPYGKGSNRISFGLQVAHNSHYLIKRLEVELLVDGISFTELRPA